MPTLAQVHAGDHKGRATPRILARTLLLLAMLPPALAVAGCSAAMVQRDGAAYTTASETPAHRPAEPHSHRFRALLAAQPPPDCEFRETDVDPLDPDLLARLKLDYELHCYQRAEAIVRDRLRQLQVSGRCEIEPVRYRRRFIR